MIEVVLVRHGATNGNLHGRYNGRTDEPLSRAGHKAALRAAIKGVAGPVYVSPMRRARQTAGLLFPDAAQVVVDGFREMDFGHFEGKNHRELEKDPDYRGWLAEGCLGRCPGGEHLDEFIGRTSAAFLRLVTETQGQSPLIVVAHGGTLMALMHRFSGSEKNYFDWHADNLSGWHAVLNRESFDKNPVFERVEKWAPAMGVHYV